MELDNLGIIGRTTETSSACHRVLLTPELATLVFLNLDKPAAFNLTCRLFHDVASSKYAVYSWFSRRYWKCEQLYELFTWSGLRKTEYIDYFLNDKAVPCSRQLVVHLLRSEHVYLSTPDRRHYAVQRTLVLSILARYPEYKNAHGSLPAHDQDDVAGAIFRLSAPPFDLLSFDNISRGSPDRGFITALFGRYGLPAYDRTGLTTLVVAILLVGYDLQWWEATLRQAAGLPTLVPEVLFNGVLDRLIIPKPAAPTHFLRYLQPAYLDMALLPVPGTSLKYLENADSIAFFKYICRVPYGVLEALREKRGRHGEASPTVLPNNPLHPYLIRLEATLLMLEKPCMAFESVPDQEAIDLIAFNIFTPFACSGNTWGKPNQIGKTLKLSQCWSMEAVSSALADPTLTALEIPQVNAYFARYAPKSLNLTASMDGAARLCLKSDATGPHLLEYTRTSPWLADFLEKHLCEEGVSGIFKPYEVDFDPSDTMQLGIYKAAMEEEVKYRGREEKEPVVLSTSVALLSILDRKSSKALRIILREAVRLQEQKIVQLYEQNGISLE